LENKQQEKIIRYLRASNTFFWNIFPGVKADVRKTMSELGLKYDVSEKATYAHLFEDVILNNEPEKIINVIFEQISRLFTTADLELLHKFWLDGIMPDIGYLKRFKLLERADIFLNINISNDYVAGWTVFAGLWFEEIEPWINKGGTNDT
jgi:hypothetical protein